MAEDVVAEVFVVCWRRFDEIPADPLPWLLGVARHVLATLRRSEHRREALHRRLANEDCGAAEEGFAPAGDSILAAALERLSDGDRELLLLIAWEGLSAAEVAAALGLRPATARVRLMRARRRLRGELARAEAGDHACRPATIEVS